MPRKKKLVMEEPTLSPSVSPSISISHSEEPCCDDYGFSPYELERGITVLAIRVRFFKRFIKLGLFVGKEQDA